MVCTAKVIYYADCCGRVVDVWIEIVGYYPRCDRI